MDFINDQVRYARQIRTSLKSSKQNASGTKQNAATLFLGQSGIQSHLIPDALSQLGKRNCKVMNCLSVKALTT